MKKKIVIVIFCVLFFASIPNILGASIDKSMLIKTNISKGVSLLNTKSKINTNDFQEVIDQQQISDCGYGCPFFNNYWLAQGFTPTLQTLTRVELELFKVGNPSIDIIVSIRDSLTGGDLASIIVDGNIVPPYGQWVDFDFSDIVVVPDTLYYIIIRTSGGSFIDYYCVLFEINNPYTGGDTWGSLNSGGSWSPVNIQGYPEPDGCFKTYCLDEIPNVPDISGPSTGKINTEQTYTVSTTDPENHDVYYFIEWGDETNSGWVGPHSSGLDISLSHSWDEKGTYTIKTKSKDTYGAESDWASYEVTMPKHFNLGYTFKFLNFLLNNYTNILSFFKC